MASEAPAVGIDLGTTFSCIAYYQNNVARVIPNRAGDKITASCVAFTTNGRIVGNEAKTRDAKSATEWENTIFGVKNFIGRTYDDPELKLCKKYYPYKIVKTNDKPHVNVNYNGENILYAPEEISAIVLQQLKDDASRHLGKEVTKAVITVPAHFNDAQRQATKNAGRIAGLNVLKIINEPTAAALAYGIHNKYQQASEKTILIYDFGGGTFDVSIITVSGGVFEVKATNGLSHLGGDDIDVKLMEFFAEEFKKKYKLDVTSDHVAMRRLRAQSEKLKITLSGITEWNLAVDMLYKDKDFEYKLTTNQFVELNTEFFDLTMDCVRETLKDANIDKRKIDEILLVGGSSRIPGVQKLLANFFGKNPNASLNPDEAVALGAAIEAAILDGDSSVDLKDTLLLDVCPLSLGLQVEQGIMSVIIPRNTPIPHEKVSTYSTTKDKQTIANIIVYEGEGTLVKRNVKLGEFTIKGLPKAPKGQVKFDVKFKVNADGILEVTASLFKNSNIGGILQVESRTTHLSDDEVNKMIQKAKSHRHQDEMFKKVVRAKSDLKDYCLELERKVAGWHLKPEDKKTILKACKSNLSYVKGKRVTEEECLRKNKELHSLHDSTFK